LILNLLKIFFQLQLHQNHRISGPHHRRSHIGGTVLYHFCSWQKSEGMQTTFCGFVTVIGHINLCSPKLFVKGYKGRGFEGCGCCSQPVAKNWRRQWRDIKKILIMPKGNL